MYPRVIRGGSGSSSPAPRGVEILAPTFLEYWAVRVTFPRARASWTGVSLARWKGTSQGTIALVCGLAGALVSGLPPGTVLVPEQIGLADGRTMKCDPALVQVFITAARALQFRVETGPMLTTRAFLAGEERDTWARRGFVAADMETGLLAEQNMRVVTVRVVLDSPEHGISPEWLRPTRAMRQPLLWREMFWLGHAAPHYALRAARVLKAGLESRIIE